MNNTIPVNVGKGYDVHIGSGLLPQSGAIAAALMPPCRAAIICGTNVAPLYLDAVSAAFSAAGFQICSMVYPAGEASKNISTLSDILEFLAASSLSRSDLVVALGGGVTGDLAGFAAGVYLRGLRYIQLPTTFLAAVDSSVGGKTAIDLKAGKNLAGVFLQPDCVICDPSCFATLPSDVFSCGTAEAVKTGVLSGPALFSLFSGAPLSPRLDDIISLCVRYKSGVVERDERESGERKLLNLGHTPAHAMEKLSGFSLPHGLAVSMGLALMARASCAMGLCAPACRDAVIAALGAYGLPTKSNFSAAELASAALSDKKRSGDSITLVLPRDIGDCILFDTPVSELESIFKLGLE